MQFCKLKVVPELTEADKKRIATLKAEVARLEEQGVEYSVESAALEKWSGR